MTETMWRVLKVLIQRHFDGLGYMALWNISHEIGIDLAGCGVPEGDNAIERLVEMGLIEELPELGCRYRIVVSEQPPQRAGD